MSDLGGAGGVYAPATVCEDPPPPSPSFRLAPSRPLGICRPPPPLRGKIAAVKVKFPRVEIDLCDSTALTACRGSTWRWAVMTMLRVTEVRRTKECWRLGAHSTEGCREVQRSDRQSLKSACGLRVCRPLRAVESAE